MKTTTKSHTWVELQVTPVEVIMVDGQPFPVSNGEPSEVTYGCFVCDMGLEEGTETDCVP